MGCEYIAGATNELDHDNIAVRATQLVWIRSWRNPAVCAPALKIPIVQTLWSRRQSALEN